MMTLPHQRQLAVAICSLMYAVSFFLPAGAKPNGPTIFGWEAFLNAILLCWCMPVWWGNAGFWLAGWLLAKGKLHGAMLASLVAALCALFPPTDISHGYGYDLLIGYYVWLNSIVLLGLTSVLFAARQSHGGSEQGTATPDSDLPAPT